MAWARIQTDAVGDSTTLTVNLPAGTGRKIIINVQCEDTGTITISGFTFGGSNCTLISDGTTNADPTIGGSTKNYGYGYYFDIPDAWSGNKDISITFSETITDMVMHSAIYTGLNTGNADVVKKFNSVSVLTNTLNITPTASVGVITAGAGQGDPGTWTQGAGETEIQDTQQTSMSGCFAEKGYTSTAANSTTQTGSNIRRFVQWNAAWGEVAGTTINAGVGTLSLVANNATITAATNITAGVDALSLVANNVNVNAATNVQGTTDALVITEYPTVVSLAVDIAANSVTLSITMYPAEVSLDVGVLAVAVALAITTHPATVTLPSGGTDVLATKQSLVIIPHAATIVYDVIVSADFVALTITPRKATITSGTPVSTYELVIGRQMIAQLTDTDFPLDMAVDSSGGVTGLAITIALRDPNDSTSYLDFSDLTFKTSGWTTQYQSLTEYGGGFYGTNLDVSGITNFPSAKHAAVEYAVTGSVVAVSQGVLSLSQTWQQAAALTVGKFLGLK